MYEIVAGSRTGGRRSAPAPHPVVVLDAAGAVLTLDSGAARLLSGVDVGVRLDLAVPWLAEAHGHVTQSCDAAADEGLSVATGDIDGRRYSAHPALLPGGDVLWSLVEDADVALLQAQSSLARERQRTEFLLEASSSLMATLNVDRCREVIAALSANHLADAAVVVTQAAAGRRMVLNYSDPSGAVQQCSVGDDPRSIVGLSEVLCGLPATPSRWLDPALMPDWLVQLSLGGKAGSVIVVALPGPGRAAGALILLRAADHGEFSPDEERFARLFASRAGAALTAARLYSEQTAVTRLLLRDLLPPQLHRIHGIEYAGAYRAAGDFEVVGGDFYDVHPGATPQDDTLVVLGDVCGKGLEAAVLAGKIRTTVQALQSLAHDHQALLALLNDGLVSAEHTRFATMVLATVSHHDEQATLRLTSAGHLPPLIVRQDGRVDQADTKGTVVGALPRINSDTFSTSLAPGEVCVLYTDGVTEARGGPLGKELFGEQRLAASLKGCAGMPAEAVVERVLMRASEWAGDRARDDIAVVAITLPRRTHLSAVDGHTRGRYTA